MTSADLRKLKLVIKDFRAGKHRQAMQDLCRLAEYEGEVPEISPRRRTPHTTRTPDYSAKALAPVESTESRKVDEDSVRRFREARPFCCIKGCGRASEVHHIIERSDHGPDDWWNLLPLCGGPTGHHTGRESWHQLQPMKFLAVFYQHLTTKDRKKILAALAQRGAFKFSRSKLHARREAAAGETENGHI